MPHTPRLRRAALTVLVALSASLLATVFAASPASAAPPTYVVTGDPAGSGGEQWQFGDSSVNGYFTDLRALLTNSADFGASGTVRANYTLAASPTVPLTAQKLANVDVYFLSGRALAGTEYAVLNQFVRNGGTVVASSNGENFFDVTDWAGFTITDRNIYGDNSGDTTHRAPAPFSTVVAEQANHPILTGPFGTVTTFDGWHSVAGFRQLPPQAVALARTPLTLPGGYANTTTLAVVPFGALGAGSGGIVATSDIDTFSNAYKTKADGHADDVNNTLTGTSNGVLARNVFAWIAAQKMQQDGVTSGYVSLQSPVRALDTRATGPLGGQGKLDLALTGAGVPVDATMVAVNVTAVDPTENGFLTVWPGGSLPVVSSVNFVSHTTVANAAFVKLGAGAKISIYNSTGNTHVLIDVVGYVASSGSRLVNAGPNRIKDTRVGLGGFGRAGAGQTQVLQVAGNGGVPNGATGVILNVTAAEPTATAYVTVWPADQAQPTVSNINTVAGTTVPNLVVVRLPTTGANVTGRINLYNAAGDTQLLVDVLGYFTNAAPAGSITAETPHREIDTRITANPLGAGDANTRTVQTGLGGATAVIINVTAVDPTATGYLTVYPADRNRPDASNVNFYAGRNTPNLVVVHPDNNGNIKVFNSAGDTQLLVDVIGRFDG